MSSIVDIATLITAIAGLATAVVALWNVKELRLMRAVTSKPSLIATDLEFVVKCERPNDADFGPGDEIPAIRVINFGNGPAIHCEAKWTIPDEDLVELLRSYDPHDQFKIGFEKSPFAEERCLRLYWNHFVTRQISERINPIIPSATGESVAIKIPPYYLEAFHLYVRLAVDARPEKKTYFPVRPFPSAKLTINLRDLADQPQTVSYQVSINYNHNATHQIKEHCTYACTLRVADELRLNNET
ncbi:MAG: hypothetical protein P4L77_03715 [Sulfuriferula sp.]|nr:hypothetical protein [Sulfuriferula sp.]